MKVKDLRPGDEIHNDLGGSATFVTAAPHPHYHGLALVVWAEIVLPPVIDIDPGSGWSLDVLSWEQEIGEVTAEHHTDRGQRLWRIFEPIKSGEGS